MSSSVVVGPLTSFEGSRTVSGLTQGVEVTPLGTRYRTWSEHSQLHLIIYRVDGTRARSIPMRPAEDGFFTATDPEGRPGDLYKYGVGDSGVFPDPATRYQPLGVHGPSMVVKNDFKWSDQNWTAPSLAELIIYELHIGTFTPEGTFTAAAEKLGHLAEIGVNAIEIMPVADFPGDRNWGYDGVCIYAPARVYGTPDEFRLLMDAAHAHGIAVILDVVYNHFGPDGNYVAALHSDYFHPTHKTPWGAAFHFELPPVRQFFLQNIAYWMDEFHADGFRLDATHAIADTSDIHILTEISSIAQDRGGFVIAEDDRNDPKLVTDVESGGIGLNGCWADDFHHVVNVMLTGNRDAYFKNYQGTGDELATTLNKGWLFTGQVQPVSGKRRGADPSFLRPEQFVYCISNHDQVGNRAFGERLSHLVSPAAYRAASVLLLLAPYTPLIFMGQEWAASSPFQFFTDHNPELGEKIIVGRRREFRDFAGFRDATVRESIPSPQEEGTFRRSKLNWDERESADRKDLLGLYRECIRLRNGIPALRLRSRDNWRVVSLENDVVAVVYGERTDECCVLVTDLGGNGISMEAVEKIFGCALSFKTLLDSSGTDSGGDISAETKQPRTILLQSI